MVGWFYEHGQANVNLKKEAMGMNIFTRKSTRKSATDSGFCTLYYSFAN